MKKIERFRPSVSLGFDARAGAAAPNHRAQAAHDRRDARRYNELLTSASATQRARRADVRGPPRRGDPRVARECEQEVSRFYSELALDREMYDTLAAVDVSGADADTQRFLAHTLRDYRRAGKLLRSI